METAQGFRTKLKEECMRLVAMRQAGENSENRMLHTELGTVVRTCVQLQSSGGRVESRLLLHKESLISNSNNHKSVEGLWTMLDKLAFSAK